ncbi:collagenase [Aliikangiella sp. G2MR2-5]|uniref:collagenase n=1 Tax=Aliikangiella sp. G2MR2-5 TaxID=2788943 RepID=UPI0018AC2E51|nr:collagenase [Aliikangiella sp. G2MR2-5]
MKLNYLLAPFYALSALTSNASEPHLDKVLGQSYVCSDTAVIRSENLTLQEQKSTCSKLSEIESIFHGVFNTKGKPVENDHNLSIRVNVYASRDSFVKNAKQHFNMPTDNGGMYLEGLPDKEHNQAEFVTYQREVNNRKVIWNLEHEYVHYLDGRFNLYGDFCASLHDSHSPPENCAKPAPLLPHTVWWTEGVAEYIAWGKQNSRALQAINKSKVPFKLSELFDTSYEHNGGSERVYSWGYFAVRYMMEEEREKVEQMLLFLRRGDYPRYQALVRHWGISMDEDFRRWLQVTTES